MVDEFIGSEIHTSMSTPCFMHESCSMFLSISAKHQIFGEQNFKYWSYIDFDYMLVWHN